MKVMLIDKSRGAECSAFVGSFNLPGGLSLVHRRDPDYFTGLSVQGKENQVIAINDTSGAISSMAVRSLKPVFINGRKRNIGYLHGLKTRTDRRNMGEAGRGYLFLRKLHSDGVTPVYVSTVLKENSDVQTMFERPKKFLPNYIPLGTYITYALPVHQRYVSSGKPSYTIMPASDIPLDRITAFWHEWGSKKQFFPVYETDDLTSNYCRDFTINNLLVALNNNTIIGTLGLWDQGSFKQTLIHEYTGWWKFGRRIVNPLLRVTGYPPLPKAGEELSIVYGSFICAKDNNPEIVKWLIRFARKRLMNMKTQFLIIGLHEKDHLSKALKGQYTLEYKSRLYLTGWEELQPFFNSLDPSLVPYLEVATL